MKSMIKIRIKDIDLNDLTSHSMISSLLLRIFTENKSILNLLMIKNELIVNLINEKNFIIYIAYKSVILKLWRR